MKKVILFVGFIGLLVVAGLYAKRKYYDPWHRFEKAKKEVVRLAEKKEIQDGDIIFHTSKSKQSKAIQLATKSKFSHCGIIFKKGNSFYVFEAIQPVKWTPLDKWIARGIGGKYVTKRLKNSEKSINKEAIDKMLTICSQFEGKNYDKTFEWTDDKIYCSELIWKVYQRALGIEVGKLEKLKDFDLSNEIVKTIMKERYGDNIPMNETVISPSSIFDSELLITVKAN